MMIPEPDQTWVDRKGDLRDAPTARQEQAVPPAVAYENAAIAQAPARLLTHLPHDVLDMIVLRPELSMIDGIRLANTCGALQKGIATAQRAASIFREASCVGHYDDVVAVLTEIETLPYPHREKPFLQLIDGIACLKDGESTEAYKAIFAKVLTYGSREQVLFFSRLFNISPFFVFRDENAYGACLDVIMELEQSHQADLLCVLMQNAFACRRPDWQQAFIHRVLADLEHMPSHSRALPLSVVLNVIWTLPQAQQKPALVATFDAIHHVLDPRDRQGLNMALQWLSGEATLDLPNAHRVVFYVADLLRCGRPDAMLFPQLGGIPYLSMQANSDKYYLVMMDRATRLPVARRSDALVRLSAFASAPDTPFKVQAYREIAAAAVDTGIDPYPVLRELTSELWLSQGNYYNVLIDSLFDAMAKCSREISLLELVGASHDGVSEKNVDYFLDRVLHALPTTAPFYRQRILFQLAGAGTHRTSAKVVDRVSRRIDDACHRLLLIPYNSDATFDEGAASSSNAIDHVRQRLDALGDYAEILNSPVAQRANLLRLFFYKEGAGAQLRGNFLVCYDDAIAELPDGERDVTLAASIRTIFFADGVEARIEGFDEVLSACERLPPASQYPVIAVLLQLFCELPEAAMTRSLAGVLRALLPLLDEHQYAKVSTHIDAIESAKYLDPKSACCAMLAASAGLPLEYRGQVILRWAQWLLNLLELHQDFEGVFHDFILASRSLPMLARNRVLSTLADNEANVNDDFALHIHCTVLAETFKAGLYPDGGVLMTLAFHMHKAMRCDPYQAMDAFFAALDSVPCMDIDIIYHLSMNVGCLQAPDQMQYFLRRFLASMVKSLPVPCYEHALQRLKSQAICVAAPELKVLAATMVNDAADLLLPGGHAVLLD